jgi:hypothetical protein
MRPLRLLMWMIFFCPVLLNGQEIRYKVADETSHSTGICISNRGAVSWDAGGVLSNYFFSSDSALLSYVLHLVVPNALNQDYRKAWYFMLSYTWSARVPLSKRGKITNGLEFFNSIGWGYCGTKSQMLSWLWSLMGYQSRVVDLGGHIVPEVFVKDHWEVWDPTYHVMYPGKDGVPMGVDSLAVHPELIYSPNEPLGIKKNFWMRMTGYSRKVAELYASRENNRVLEMEVALSSASNPLVFELPAHSQMVFPVYSGIPLWSDFGKEIKRLYDYAECAVYLEKGNLGVVRFPLVLHAVTSDGATIQTSQKRIVLNSQNNGFVTVGATAENEVEIIENTHGVWLYYLVNPQLIQRQSTIAEIQADVNGSEISIVPVTLAATNRVNVILLTDVQHGLHLDKFRKAFFRWISAKK